MLIDVLKEEYKPVAPPLHGCATQNWGQYSDRKAQLMEESAQSILEVSEMLQGAPGMELLLLHRRDWKRSS